MVFTTLDSAETGAWLEQIRWGDAQALEDLLARCRPLLRAFVEVRLDQRLRRRVDCSDVVQEVQVEVLRRMDEYLRDTPMPFALWLSKIASQRLLNLRRDHHRQRRSLKREVTLTQPSSLLLVRRALGAVSTPSQQVQAQEQAQRIHQAVARLSEADQEILWLRHVEELPYEEIACLLEIEPATARKRYGRALIRLQKVLSEHGLLE
jgi:RNA polymerase sigma-70 factor (ECF subfamily)